MARHAAVPFRVKRSNDVMGEDEYTSTQETIYGLVVLEGDRLVIQWRLKRTTDRYGTETRSDQEMEPVREVEVPLSGVSGASVRRRWWQWLGAPRLVLTAADLRAFEVVVREGSLSLGHPGELVLPIRRRDSLSAEEFAAEVTLALAERTAPRLDRLGGRPREALPDPHKKE